MVPYVKIADVIMDLQAQHAAASATPVTPEAATFFEGLSRHLSVFSEAERAAMIIDAAAFLARRRRTLPNLTRALGVVMHRLAPGPQTP